MAQQDEIVLKVDIDSSQVAKHLGEATNQVRVLKEEQKLLDKALKDGTITEENYGKAIAENKMELEKANREVKSSTALLQAEAQARIDENASLDEQRQVLNAVQKAYGQLTGEAKEAADAEGGLRDQINALNDRVKEQEEAMGDHRRNVGNYTESIIEASDELGGFGGGLSSLLTPMKNATMGLKAMSATPIIAILGLLVQILLKLAEKFKGNAAAMEKLTELFGVFSGAANIVNKIVDKIAEGLGWLAEKALELAEKLGILNDDMKAGQQIAKEDIAIQKEQQRVALANAESQNKIAKLKAAATETDKHTAAERLKMYQEAADEEEAIAKRQYELAKREYELQVLKNSQSASSLEDLKQENDLKVAMIQAETDLFSKQQELNGQMAGLRTQLNAEAKAQADAARKAEVEAQEQYMKDIANLAAINANSAALQAEEIKRQAEAALAALDEDEEVEEPPTPEEMARDMFGLDSEGLEFFKNLLAEGVGFSEAKTRALADQAVRMTQNFATSFGQLGQSFSGMSDAISQLAGESEEAQAAQKAFTFTSILLNQAQAISEGALAIAKGVSSAASIPFPGNIPAIISVTAQIGGMVAGVMTSIAQAKQLFDTATPKFATGGIVGGTSYSGDNVVARLNSREMVITPEQQTVLFDAISGKGDGSLGINYEMMAAAMASTPAPVVVYSELEQFGQKVATYKEIAKV